MPKTAGRTANHNNLLPLYVKTDKPMKNFLLIFTFAAVFASEASAQRIYRSEITTYDTREAALAGDHSATINHIAYLPKGLGHYANHDIFNSRVTIPTAWVDYNVYIHIENAAAAYRLAVGDNIVAEVDDPFTPADFLISPYIRQGENDIMLMLHTPDCSKLNEDTPTTPAAQFENCYIYAQYRTHIHDWSVSISPDGQGEAILSLDVALSNSFGTPQNITVGYDIYSPEGNLIDYAVREQEVAGRSTDTLRIRASLGAVGKNVWSAGHSPLWRMMLYQKRDGKPREYIPFHAGMVKASYADNRITINGKPLDVKGVRYNAAATRKTTAAEIAALKKRGYNTLQPSHPQPKWFYDMCDRAGVYVIESASINPTTEPDNRKVGGTPSNDPTLAAEYVERVKSMYWRTRNHPCIVAYSLCGSEAGNGYCLYEAYRYLKGVEQHRAVICTSAAGEWNTDIEGLQ